MDFFPLILMVTALHPSATQELSCEDYDVENYVLVEGESFHFVPYALDDSMVPLEKFTWFRNSSGRKRVVVPSGEMERIHHHGGALFLLNVTVKDSGSYTARQNITSEACNNYYVNITVREASRAGKEHFYGALDGPGGNKHLVCPDPVLKICRSLGGALSWYKNDILLADRRSATMWLHNLTAEDQGVYTCVCTWTHEGHQYTTSGSREVTIKNSYSSNLLILAPTENISTHEGVELRLNCTVFCGTNINPKCSARWQVGEKNSKRDGYTQSMNVHTLWPSQSTVATAILTIAKVSSRDFRTNFKCIGTDGFLTTELFFTPLRSRETLTPVWLAGVCVVLLCVSAVILVKVFTVDITLLLRPYLPMAVCNKDSKRYDAYVVLETPQVQRRQNGVQYPEKPPEDANKQMLAFVEQLVSVLENACRYHLFVQHRDSLPGEAHITQVQKSIEQSRRLILVLAPHSESSDQQIDSSPRLSTAGFDWQVALHHVLTQPNMAVIFIQVGQAGDYAHLPPTLRYLLAKNVPLKWSPKSHGTATRHSRFWKNVRYLMPVRPATCPPQFCLQEGDKGYTGKWSGELAP
ncbi:interleukin-1 receptor-like 2 [Syngnathus scovelli]|uniref:interleukin-1 receptor-like 2 n=1 Tax=Syngnathus scovelli TaxID=161590 RepID=UPI00210F71E1|nr:interleukin-1 receptor-like 2 [Syngnathus scovelli]